MPALNLDETGVFINGLITERNYKPREKQPDKLSLFMLVKGHIEQIKVNIPDDAPKDLVDKLLPGVVAKLRIKIGNFKGFQYFELIPVN